MKTRFTLSLLLVLSVVSVLWTACDDLGVSGSGAVVKQKRYLRDFSSISILNSGKVHVRQDTAFSVEVASNQNILDVLSTEVHNGELVIKFDENVRRYTSLDIYISLPEINALNVSGSADVLAENDWVTNAPKFTISGSGNILLKKLNANDLTTTISGSGNMSATSGSMMNENLRISGSGNINLKDAMSETCDARISGSGDITLYTTRTLNATITGSGNIRYRGTASVSTNITGSGSVKPM